MEKGSQAGWRQRTERQLDLIGGLEGGDGEEGIVKEDVKDYKEAEVEEDHKEEGGRWTTRSPCCPVHGL